MAAALLVPSAEGAGTWRLRQLPMLWMPFTPAQISVIRSDLKGVVQLPDFRLAAEDWYYVR